MQKPKGEAFAYGVATRLKAANTAGLPRDRLFGAMVEIIYLAARNGAEPPDDAWQERETRFHQIRAELGDEAVRTFSAIAGSMLLEAMQRNGDLLGEISEALDLAEYGMNSTSYEVSRTTAGLALPGVEAALAAGSKIEIQDTCSGTGGMAIAVRETLMQMDIDPITSLRIAAYDPDPLCWRMTYIPCWLYGIPANVILGDAARDERIEVAITPALRKAMAGAAGD